MLVRQYVLLLHNSSQTTWSVLPPGVFVDGSTLIHAWLSQKPKAPESQAARKQVLLGWPVLWPSVTARALRGAAATARSGTGCAAAKSSRLPRCLTSRPTARTLAH
jgi:hypothetical protein